MAHALLILGNQLFDPAAKPLKARAFDRVYMREDFELCTHYKYHQKKIALFLMAMRTYADELRARKWTVDYEQLEVSKKPYELHFKNWLERNSIAKVTLFEIEDKFFETRILKTLAQSKIEIEVLRSPMFLTTRDQFKVYLAKSKRPFMRTFYEQQRRRLKIMIDENQDPVGGRWSFDELNRKPLPKTVTPPAPELEQPSEHFEDVRDLCTKLFKDHPGELESVWFATREKVQPRG